MLLAEHPDYSIVYSAGGDFTREGGRLVVEQYLREHAWDIDVIYSHNDDMALGAVDALEAAGIQPGRDVKIISVDGTEEAVKALEEGRLNCVVECSPLLGPQLMKAVTDLMSGKELPLRIITDERVFTAQTPERSCAGANIEARKRAGGRLAAGPFPVSSIYCRGIFNKIQPGRSKKTVWDGESGGGRGEMTEAPWQRGFRRVTLDPAARRPETGELW